MSSAVGNAPIQFAPTRSQLNMAYAVCRGIARSAAKNFYYGFVVFPPRKRNALAAVYAFMRRCDDIADDAALSILDRQNKLTDWLDKVHRAFAGYPTDDAVLMALTDAQRAFQIPVGLLDQLAFGTAADLDENTAEPYQGSQTLDDPTQSQSARLNAAPSGLVARYKTFDDLRKYCYGVASVVGLVCIRIFGYRDPAAEPLAEQCGLAFQLTNIVRDVKEDAAMGRVYLPEEDLLQCGLQAGDLAEPEPARIRPVLVLEADRARECYRAGEQLIDLVSEDSQPGLWVLITIYRRLLEKIAANDYDVFSKRIRLSVPEKLSVLIQGMKRRLL
ncbi:MAG TPA: phytoene/squalene synthase family protein [Terriglobales bacterium]|nr:phytoene/squalene synthase family protein [Terriglobales bacterium]